MAWELEYSPEIRHDLKRLDPQVKARIGRFLAERVAKLDDPRSIGEALKGESLGELWKCRVGDWRIITSIEDVRLVVLVVKIGHRREVFR